MSTELPTKPGNYYWREKDGDEWELLEIMFGLKPYDNALVARRYGCSYSWGLVEKLQGQWLPIPTAEELVELQATKKMVDEGQEAFMVFDKFGRVRHLGDVRDYAKLVGRTWQELAYEGYTCELATIIKEEKR